MLVCKEDQKLSSFDACTFLLRHNLHLGKCQHLWTSKYIQQVSGQHHHQTWKSKNKYRKQGQVRFLQHLPVSVLRSVTEYKIALTFNIPFISLLMNSAIHLHRCQHSILGVIQRFLSFRDVQVSPEIYRLFKKEGVKQVNGYCRTTIWILGAVQWFIVAIKMGHLIICIRFKNFSESKHDIFVFGPQNIEV